MHVLVISHKECWSAPGSGELVTVGGFPFQLAALAALFERTTLIAARRAGPPPAGARPLRGARLDVRLLPEPAGRDLVRKLALLAWLPRHGSTLWRAVREADAVHALVPGDLGGLGLLVALAQRKPLLVRHCGTWGAPRTVSDRLLHALLRRVAGGRRVVLATGGGPAPPDPGRQLRWIFATTLSSEALARLPRAPTWRPGERLRLVSVGRLTRGKNVLATIETTASLLARGLDVELEVIGDGPLRGALEARARALDLKPRVRFRGSLAHDEVLTALGRSHLLLFPTRGEGFPKALLEALACGVPAVASAVSVIPELLQAHGCGLAIPAPGPEALTDAVLELTRDPERLATMAARGRAAARRYTLEAWQQAVAAAVEPAWGTGAVRPPDHAVGRAEA